MELDQLNITLISDEDAEALDVAPPRQEIARPIKAPPPLKMPRRSRKSNPMRYARNVFAIAGIYGLIVTIPMFFNEKQFGIDHPPAISHPEFYYGFAGLCLAWQVMFLIIAADPIRFRPAMIAAVLEKVSFVFVITPLFFLNKVGLTLVGAAAVDAFFAIAFGVAYFSCKPKQ